GVSGARAANSQLGEPKVWLCAVGLTLGMLMIGGLLLLILFQGLSAFWPLEVIQLTVRTPDGKTEFVAGEVRKIQLRRDPAQGGKRVEEWLVFTGNKDATGNAFRYLNESSITERSLPEGIVVAERMEYGDSIFYPVSLKLSDGKVIAASDAAFPSELAHQVELVNSRRSEIQRLEKSKIGNINQKLNRLQLEAKGLNSARVSPDAHAERLKQIEAKRATLQADYQKLATEAQALRARQTESTLTYKLANGTERSQPVGDLVSFYQPNALGFFGKLGWFLYHAWEFLTSEPREANTEGGIFQAIFGTFVMTVFMSLLVTPFGVIAAIYLREYARQGFLVQAVRVSVNNLAGVPSIVFGVFGLGFFVYLVGGTIDSVFFSNALPTPTFGTGGILWASFTLAMLTLPVVIVATEEALVAVPRGVREAGLACGASKWQMIQRVVLPSALPGILTGVILVMARGAGEVAPLMLVGVVKLAPSLPLDLTAPFVHAERKFMHLGFHIYDLGFQSPDSEVAKPMVFATTLFLILLVVVMNVAAILIRNRLRKKYAASTF
ncbi:MAG: phosphate ABC transporter permease PstA, partial [Roseimicrobium sp.]